MQKATRTWLAVAEEFECGLVDVSHHLHGRWNAGVDGCWGYRYIDDEERGDGGVAAVMDRDVAGSTVRLGGVRRLLRHVPSVCPEEEVSLEGAAEDGGDGWQGALPDLEGITEVILRDRCLGCRHQGR